MEERTKDPGSEESQPTLSLIVAAQAGHQPARDVLFRRYLEVVSRIVRLKAIGTQAPCAEADDLIQEALLRALARLDSFEWRGEGSFRHWLSGIVSNLVRDEYRRSGRPSGTLERQEKESMARLDPPYAGDTASQIAMGEEASTRIDRGLQRLSATDRELIVMRSICGMSFRQIADSLSYKNESTARSSYNRARARLSEFL